MDIRTCGVIVLCICAICGTALLLQKMRQHNTNTVAWTLAFEQRGADQNSQERQNWIATNCELVAQIELLRAEADQYKKTLAKAGVADVAEFKKWLAERSAE